MTNFRYKSSAEVNKQKCYRQKEMSTAWVNGMTLKRLTFEMRSQWGIVTRNGGGTFNILKASIHHPRQFKLSQSLTSSPSHNLIHNSSLCNPSLSPCGDTRTSCVIKTLHPFVYCVMWVYFFGFASIKEQKTIGNFAHPSAWGDEWLYLIPCLITHQPKMQSSDSRL